MSEPKPYLDRDRFPAEDLPPTAEHLEAEADLELATDEFETHVEGLMEREIIDRKAAEDTLDIIDGWLIRIEKTEESPGLKKLSDIELFERPGGNKEAAVAPVAIIRHWMGRTDNFERLMAFRDALDQERFELPEHERPAS